jgi:hypothetical protein
MARPSLLALACWGWSLAACNGEFVNLGSSDATLGDAGSAGGGVVSHVWDVASQPLLPEEKDVLMANPSLTSQGELFFSRQEHGSTSSGDPKPAAVWHALPSGAGFGTAQPLSIEGGDMLDISSPAVSYSGDELWLGRNLSGSTDVYRSVPVGNGWSAPEAVPELSSDSDDAPRPPALNGTLMPLSSKRHGERFYQIYFAERGGSAAPWDEPSQALLAAVNSPTAAQTADGFLTENGLELYFSSTRAGTSDLYVSRRATLNDAFGAPEALADFNTDAEERMPWLSRDGQLLYFVSNRATASYAQYALYVARKR